ncbi:ArsC family reductase [Aurantiacibacter poecillastricola]|uniref:ArsC family reductase n=1 Tax=Aurantiacibacter poecillastricola TaxID=3064385 RepID=UPI00273F3A00|nr:ArsC family reductase [Aurantiacibacter sp. 219JJ12-13]MDP5260849.1 ArsC family reductase [Aurantiacibacter sp. 219JJ12-13]
MTNIHLYGLSNCDTVRKARKWLDEQGHEYAFHDYKKEGVEGDSLSRWADRCGWEVLLNRRGTTFRKLDESDKADIDRDKALALMEVHPSMIKRPVVETDDGERVLVGFTQSEWENTLG